jgi:valyl-tRNA synthetase
MIVEVEGHLTDYRLDLAAHALYEFVWNEYCDWYLEFTKPTMQGNDEARKAATRHTLLTVLETTLRVLHPIMPFITEEIWQRTREPLSIDGDSIMLQPFPEPGMPDDDIEQEVEWLKEVVQGVRRIRSELNVSPAKPLEVRFQAGDAADRSRQQRFETIFSQLARVSSCEWIDESADTAQCAVALVGDLKILVPLKGLVDVEAELARLRKQLDAEMGNLAKAKAKLENRRFVENAPQTVVEQEQERRTAHQANSDKLQEQIDRVKSLRD